MMSASRSPIRQEKAPPRVDFLAPAVVVSSIIAIFAVVTQLLNVANAASLSSTQMLTVWLVAAGLIVLLWMTYMISRSLAPDGNRVADLEQALTAARRDLEKAWQEVELARSQVGRAGAPVLGDGKGVEQRPGTAVPAGDPDGIEASERLNELRAAKSRLEQDLKAAQRQLADARTEINLLQATPLGAGGAGDDDAWIPPEEFRYMDGSQHSVSASRMFPHGCYLEPDSVRLGVDRLTGQQVYLFRILDLNPELKDRPHETVVSIAAGQQPALPDMPRFGRVTFDGLTITPYVIDQSHMRIRYSLHATRVRLAGGTPERPPATWTAAGADDLIHR